MATLDLAILGGMLIDGTGNPWVVADLGVKNGRIVAMGDLKRARAARTIDATARVVAPGFVDAHAHSDYLILADPTNENKLLQGVTLDVAGNCGYSAAPLGDVWFQEWWVADIAERFSVCSLERGREVLRDHGVELSWNDLRGYLAAVDAARPSTNYLNFVGQVALRLAAYGDYGRRPNVAEFRTMKRLLRESMRAGSFGVSTESGSHKGMDFDVAELIDLCKIAHEFGGVYSNHMRDYGKQVVASTEEALYISEQSGIPSIISHIGVEGRQAGVPAEALLGLLDAARERNIQVTADIMPYGYSESLTFSARAADLLPEWATEGGADAFPVRMDDPVLRRQLIDELRAGRSSRFYVSPTAKPGEAYHTGPLGYPGWEERLEIVSCAGTSFAGRRVGAIAREAALDPFEVLIRALEADFDTIKIFHNTWSEADLRAMLTHPWVAFGGDGAQTRAMPRRPGLPNPTQYGVFPMVLGRYVRQKGWLRWEDAIRKMTSLPCTALGIYDRGILRPGAWADITIFDPDRIIDCPSYLTYPEPYANGIEHVVVNGVVTVADGVQTGERGGKALRRP